MEPRQFSLADIARIYEMTPEETASLAEEDRVRRLVEIESEAHMARLRARVATIEADITARLPDGLEARFDWSPRV